MAIQFEGLKNNPVTENIKEVGLGNATEHVETTSTTEVRTPTDPKLIHVNVSERRAPIILLFGAPSSGKTMTLVRLAKYLNRIGYSLQTDENFVTTRNVWEYEENCNGFNKMLGTTTALGGTDRNDFLFVKVIDKFGHIVCQILEGAGEDYFPINDPNRVSCGFPGYMNGVFGTSNKKIWIFITEPNWKVDNQAKIDYVKRIAWCKGQFFNENDRAIILYNKVDKSSHLLYGQGKVHMDAAMTDCDNEYQGIFDTFINPSPLAGFLSPKYLCKFVPFCTGQYTEALKREEQNYTLSHPSYPAALWEAIMDSIKS